MSWTSCILHYETQSHLNPLGKCWCFCFGGNLIPPLKSHWRLLDWDGVNLPAFLGFGQRNHDLSRFQRSSQAETQISDEQLEVGQHSLKLWIPCGVMDSKKICYALLYFELLIYIHPYLAPAPCHSSDSIHLSVLPFSFRKEICMNRKL